ncbi:FIT family protein CG10671-like [Brachionus plicatilis]|uniref:FIT family protein CG10671-like n=1 Tax=Brachionus plicatilis TaxID=10195 RepID=A0A3M7SKN1_BRAPC|nr:FIT family protein CG10671-like [Brachionus plicatilis]
MVSPRRPLKQLSHDQMNSSHPNSNQSRRPSERSSGGQTNSGKKSLNISQQSVMGFLYSIIIYIIKRIVFCPVNIKVGIYLMALIICSVIKDFKIISPTYYLAYKNNIFNKFFVKIGWGWTLAVLTPFVIMTSSIYNCFNLIQIKNHLIRIFVATFFWFTFTSVFEYIDSQTGYCAKNEYRSKMSCKINKEEWLNGFDISGHIFLLMHSLFLMNEEIKVFSSWTKIYDNLEKRENLESSNERFYRKAKDLHKKLTPFVNFNFVLIGLLALLWEVMLLSTCLFFHTILHKLLAAFCAIGLWFLTYKNWYADQNSAFSPGLPLYGSVCSLNCYKNHKEKCEIRKVNESKLPEIVTKPCEKDDDNHEKSVKLVDYDVEINSNSSLELKDIESDFISKEKLKLLENSIDLKQILQNRHLRELLVNLNNSTDGTNIDEKMEKAMQEPLFQEFSDACLKIVQNENDLEKN